MLTCSVTHFTFLNLMQTTLLKCVPVTRPFINHIPECFIKRTVLKKNIKQPRLDTIMRSNIKPGEMKSERIQDNAKFLRVGKGGQRGIMNVT